MKRRIHIGVEGGPLYGNLTGVGHYAKNITEALSQTDKNLNVDILRFWLPWKKKITPIKINKRLGYRFIRWFPPAVYFQTYKRLGWVLPYDYVVAKRYNYIIFYNFVCYPTTKKVQKITVIHDLCYLRHPQYVSPKNLDYLKKFVPKSLSQTNKIIAISENTKNEIMKYYDIPEERISVITPAIDHSVFHPQSKSAVKKVKNRYNITKPYLLCVGTIEPRKNLTGVLNAFDMLPESIKNSHSLVLVGGKGWLDSEIEHKIGTLGQKYSIIKTGYVPAADLPALYTGASIFLFPTFYEGFGIPPLEAMACGCPVITSDNSSLPEVVGNAAIKIKANDHKSLSREITKVLKDNKLSSDLKNKGLMQAKKFSWAVSAEKLSKILD